MITETEQKKIIRNDTIEECARRLEEIADKINDLIIREREKLSDSTVDCFYWEKAVRRNSAKDLRLLKTS